MVLRILLSFEVLMIDLTLADLTTYSNSATPTADKVDIKPNRIELR
jgi:hypothetical protein